MPDRLMNENRISIFERNMDSYLKMKPRDCVLYSEDGAKFKAHKEVLIQTKFMRDILASTNEYCNDTIKIFCPCKTEDLKQLVFFLYDGEIQCNSEEECNDFFENLNKIFGFPEDLRHNCQEKALETDVSTIAISKESNNDGQVLTKVEYWSSGEETIEDIKDITDLENAVTIPPKESNEVGGIADEANIENIDSNDVPTIKISWKLDYFDPNVVILNDSEDENVQDKSMRDLPVTQKKCGAMTAKSRKVARKFGCEHCGHYSRKKSLLKNHIDSVHLKVKPFKCGTCGRGFYYATDMKRHVNAVHLKLKPFGCTFCQQSFSLKSNLKKHLKRYHNTCNENVQGEAMNTKKKCGAKKAKSKKGVEGKFGCGFCGKSFSKNSNLKLHREFHHKSKIFKCIMCNSSFKKEPLLKMHIRKNHASEKSKIKAGNESKVVLVSNEYWSSGEETGPEETKEDIEDITDLENAVTIPPKESNEVGGNVDEANMENIVTIPNSDSNGVPKIKISEVATNSGEMEEDSGFQLQLSEDESGRF